MSFSEFQTCQVKWSNNICVAWSGLQLIKKTLCVYNVSVAENSNAS